MKPDKLLDGMVVLARFAKRDTEDGTAPDWGEPKQVTLQVTTFPPNKKRRNPLVSIVVRDFDWAEYTDKDYCPPICGEDPGCYLVEEYRMEIIKEVK